MLWDCEHCGCQGIADSLLNCPVCGKGRPDPDPGTPTEVPAVAEDGRDAPDGPERPDGPASRPAQRSRPGPKVGSPLPEGWEAKQ
jgi:hypothetical protein